MNNNKLIEELSKLTLEEKSLKRNLDKYSNKSLTRTKIFYRLNEVKSEINKIKFKIKLEKELKDEKSR